MSQELANARKAGILLQEICHACSARSGWWKDVSFSDPMLVPTKLMLVVSELAEAMEGHRKSLMDDKLPHRTMLEVESTPGPLIDRPCEAVPALWIVKV